jgi:hypothetical protein
MQKDKESIEDRVSRSPEREKIVQIILENDEKKKESSASKAFLEFLKGKIDHSSRVGLDKDSAKEEHVDVME